MAEITAAWDKVTPPPTPPPPGPVCLTNGRDGGGGGCEGGGSLGAETAHGEGTADHASEAGECMPAPVLPQGGEAAAGGRGQQGS